VDKILVLNDGQVEDFGTAAEIAAKFAARNKQVEGGGAAPNAQIGVTPKMTDVSNG
jgi:ABC-type protease/lipase transport system fused ATPase/permease subunit